MVESQDIVKILNDESLDDPGKRDAIIVLIGGRIREVAVKLIWDATVFVATHPKKGSVNNIRILDIVFQYYTDEE